MRTNVSKVYIDWISRGLQKPGKNKKGLAGVLGVHPSQVSQLLKGKRRLLASELTKVSEYLEEAAPSESNNVVTLQTPSAGALGSAHAVPLVRVAVVIAPSVWREAGAVVLVAERIPASPDPRVASVKQYACRIEAEPNRFAVCVPYGSMRSQPVANDVVHVRRTRKGFFEDTLRVVRLGAKGQVRLELEGSNKQGEAVLTYPAAKNAETVEIKGLVVGYHVTTTF